MPVPSFEDAVIERSAAICVTVHVSRLRTRSSVVVASRRSLRRVTMTSPTQANSSPAIGARKLVSMSPALARACWMAWLMRSTWSLLDAVMARVSPAACDER
jgi:hypothetical protein